MKNKVVYILLLMALGMWSCHNHNHNDGHDHDHGTQEIMAIGDEHANDEIVFTQEQAEETGLEVTTIRLAPFHQVIKTSGEILSAQGDERTISATVSGIISFNKVSLNTGTSIKAGETIISISSRYIGEGDPSQKAIAAYNIAKQDFERAESLIQDKLISQSEYNAIKLNYENAKVTHEALGRNQTQKGMGITSSINGFVKNRMVSEGDFVEVGQALLTVSQNRRLQLQANVSERYYSNLENIVSANFCSPYDNKIYKLSELNGKLISYGKSTFGQEYYIPVNFEFDNADRIVSGSYVEIFLLSQSRENIIAVPVAALIEEQGIYSVYLQLHKKQRYG